MLLLFAIFCESFPTVMFPWIQERMRQHAEVTVAETGDTQTETTVSPPADAPTSFEPRENETDVERQERLNNRQWAEMQETETRLRNELNDEVVRSTRIKLFHGFSNS